MKIICVSGVPGTGKTTLAKKLAKKLNFYYLDVSKLILSNKLYEGYDKKRRTKIVDVKKLTKFLISEIKNFQKLNKSKKFSQRKLFDGIIIDSHLSHYLPRKYVDLCIVVKCDIKELNRRLKKKNFHKNKIIENIQAEIFNVCYEESVQRNHKIIAINTTKGFNIDSLTSKLGWFNVISKG